VTAFFNPAAPASIFASLDADEVAEVCIGIEQRDGVLTPEAVVDAAASLTSPLHSFFEWDDTKAGRHYRLQQARNLIGSLYITPLATATKVSVDVRAFPHIPGAGGGYVSQGTVASSPDLAIRLVEQYDRELRAVYARNRAWERTLKKSRVGGVVTAIEAYIKANPKP